MPTRTSPESSADLQSDLIFALAMADAADAITMGLFGSASLKIDTKADHTPVTEADQDTEQLLRRILAEQRPADSILGEEFGASATTQARQWILDPIDGTKNYLRGVPVWASLISLVINEDPVLGVVSAPALNRRWWAASGSGAWMRFGANPARRLQVSPIDSLAQASFSYSDSVGWAEHGARKGLDQLLGQTARQRAFGDFWSHMLVAEGAVEIAAEPELGLWDMAALIPIVREAGGRATAFDGTSALSRRSLLSTNDSLHDRVLELLHP